MSKELAEKLMANLSVKAEEGEDEVNHFTPHLETLEDTEHLFFLQEEEEEEEDLVDPASLIKEACAESHCTSMKSRLDECNDRVNGKNKTTETCFEEILDFYHCVDHCAAPSVFNQVK